MRIAITREVSPAIGRCELTHLPRTPIDVARAQEQHRAYCRTLAALGCEVLTLPPAPALPDAVFVEDTALVTDEVAVVLRPGAASRRPEVDAVAAELARHRQVLRMEGPGTVDGGDALRIERTVHVGLSQRSDAEGIAELGRLLRPFGYEVRPVPVRGCLHLKSAVTEVGDDVLLLNPQWVDPDRFRSMASVEVHPEEPRAANALRIGGAVVYPASHRRTAERLARRGITVRAVDVSELEKAEGAVTCCSLVFEERGSP